MSTSVYVVGFEPPDRAWIELALAGSVDALDFLDDGQGLLDAEVHASGHCVLASADANGPAVLTFVRALRDRGIGLPVIVLGPHAAFRTAVEIARLDATDFLERPVSMRELRAAVRRASREEGPPRA